MLRKLLKPDVNLKYIAFSVSFFKNIVSFYNKNNLLQILEV